MPAFLAFLLTLYLLHGAASADEPEDPSQSSTESPKAEPDTAKALAWLGCEARAYLELSDRVVAACGRRGVLIALRTENDSLAVAQWRRTDGQAQGVHLDGARVWIEVVASHAVLLEELESESGGASPTDMLVTAPAQAAPEGHVLSAQGGHATVSLGRSSGIEIGQRVEVYERLPDDTGLEEAERERTVLIGEVIALGEDKARIKIGLGEEASAGQLARVSERPVTASLVAPPRTGHLWEIQASLRPFLPLDELAFAALSEASLTYRDTGPWYGRLDVRPLGIMAGSGKEVVVFGTLASGGYDHTYFSVGFGVGALRQDDQAEAPRIDLAATQSARLGARDGLHLQVTNAFVLEDDRWQFGYLEMLGQIPLATGSWLTAGGGGGANAGYFYVELGLRRLLRGNGGAGSLFVRPSVGAAGLSRSDVDGFKAGPMVGASLEWRL